MNEWILFKALTVAPNSCWCLTHRLKLLEKQWGLDKINTYIFEEINTLVFHSKQINRNKNEEGQGENTECNLQTPFPRFTEKQRYLNRKQIASSFNHKVYYTPRHRENFNKCNGFRNFYFFKQCKIWDTQFYPIHPYQYLRDSAGCSVCCAVCVCIKQ